MVEVRTTSVSRFFATHRVSHCDGSQCNFLSPGLPETTRPGGLTTLIGFPIQLRVQGRGSQAGGTTRKTLLAATTEASRTGTHRLGFSVFRF
ncbi:MAG TPA: hypothetical protein VJY33_04760 [Isosphaeraceae bacterium]|nr:hypothetical protein [Isosphaeraceae bacterium]